MFSEADAFLDAIFTEPADDTPRLVYADWLEEHGHEDLGQFIRLQCAIDPLTNDNPRRFGLRHQEKKVWAALKKRWGAFFEAMGIKKHEFRRGFFTGWVHLDAGTFFDRYPEGWPWFPIQNLRVRHAAGTASRFAQAPELISQVAYLGVGDNVEPEVLTALALVARMPQIERLDVAVARLTRTAVEELARASWIDRVRGVQLGDLGFFAGESKVRRDWWYSPNEGMRPEARPTVREHLLAWAEQLVDE